MIMGTPARAARRIPVFVLTGFLGSGKTTLLSRLIRADGIAGTLVIINEFGEVGLDHMLVESSDEQIVLMESGCVCCTMRGDLAQTLGDVALRLARGDLPPISRVVLETTGLADPAPVAQTFFVDEDVRAKTRLDSVTAVVDAKHILLRLSDSREAAEQIAFADQIVLNKTDLVSEDDLRMIEARIRRLNPLAPIHRAQRSNVPLDAILGRGGFDLDRILDLEPEFLNPAHGEAGHVHDEHCGHDHDHGHGHDHHHGRDHDHGESAHDDDIRGVSLRLDRPVDANKITRWLNELLQAQGPDILRAKGILDVKGEDRRLVFQAVHMILEGDLQRPWRDGDSRHSRMVFIGRNLDEAALKAGFEACVA